MAIIIRRHLKLVHSADRVEPLAVDSGRGMSDQMKAIVKAIAEAAAYQDHMDYLEEQWSKR